MNYYGETESIPLVGYVTVTIVLVVITSLVTIFKLHTETITPTISLAFIHLLVQFCVTNYIGYKTYPNSFSKVFVGTMIMTLLTGGILSLFNMYITPNYLKKDDEDE